MQKPLVVIGCLALVLLLFVSCAPAAPAAPAAAPQQPGVSPAPAAVPAVAPWQKEWDKVMEAAKKEGKVVVYSTGGSETRAVLSKGLKEKFGLTAEFVTAPGSAMAEKILTERRAGLYMADIYIGGGTTVVNQLRPAGVFDSFEPALILPEVTNPKLWWGGQHTWVDKDHQIFLFETSVSGQIGINTELVKPEEIKVLNDLQNAKWKGKILLNDPTVAGTGLKFVGVVATMRGWDFWKEIARKQEPAVLRDARLQVEWLARGKYAIHLVPKPEPMAEFIKAGAPIAPHYLNDIAYVTGDLMGLPKNGPHPNAAKVFINWFLGPEGQKIYHQAQGTQSSREDVGVAGSIEKRREPGVEYFNSMTEEFLVAQAEHMKTAKEVFAAFIK